jgi:hydroxyacylglutathione hydrolase
MTRIHPIHALKDNLIWLICDASDGTAIAVDPSEAAPVLRYLEEKQLGLAGILNTHHHFDHVGGNIELQKRFPDAAIFCSEYDRNRIPFHTKLVPLTDLSEFSIGSKNLKTVSVPGHTLGHTLFYLEFDNALFTGDTLFSLGCGRLFEGTPEQMWSSLEKIMSFPEDTLIYCGHEYTLSNHHFAQSLEPENAELNTLNQEIIKKLSAHTTSLPTLLGAEKKFNPFLRLKNNDFRARLNLRSTPVEAFAQLRELKNNFKG